LVIGSSGSGFLLRDRSSPTHQLATTTKQRQTRPARRVQSCRIRSFFGPPFRVGDLLTGNRETLGWTRDAAGAEVGRGPSRLRLSHGRSRERGSMPPTSAGDAFVNAARQHRQLPIRGCRAGRCAVGSFAELCRNDDVGLRGEDSYDGKWRLRASVNSEGVVHEPATARV
jgi:hypothetical protein